LSAIGPCVSSSQFTATRRITSAKLIETMTKYAPRTLNAMRPMNQPARPAAIMPISIASQTGFASTTTSTGTVSLNPSAVSELAYAPMPKNATCPSESCPAKPSSRLRLIAAMMKMPAMMSTCR
jgi:hypothetical protein